MATAATAKRKNGFRDSARKTRRDVKRYARDKAQRVKRYAREKAQRATKYAKTYYDTLEGAFNIGYERGFTDAAKVPKRFGSVTAAAAGYGIGVRNHRRINAYNARYGRSKK